MPRPNNNGESKKKRAQQILDAAEELLGELGYDGISAREIAERAGVNKALVFYYWGSKAELFERIVERYYKRHREAVARGFSEEGTLDERVHRMLDSYLDFIEDNRLYPRLVQQQLTGGGPHLELVQKHLSTFFEWTTRILSELTPEEGPQSARHFYLSISGIVTSYFTYTPVLAHLWGRDPASPEALAERRAHVHWMVDAVLARLQSEQHSR